MKHRLKIVALLIPLVAAGCQNRPQTRALVDSYNAELRQLEDQNYLLEQDLQVQDQYIAKLEKKLGHLDDKPKERPHSSGLFSPKGGSNSSSTPEPMPPGLDVQDPDDPPASKPDTEPDSAPSKLNRPMTNVPTDDIGPVMEEEAQERPASRMNHRVPGAVPAPTVTPADLPSPPANPKKAPEPEVIDTKVTHLHLNPLHTGGADFDRVPGDDGLSVLLEPRNGSEQFVPLAGPVSVVLLDPAQVGDAARVARWDFGQSEAEGKLLRDTPRRGIHLELPWPAKIPASNRLQLFVRYETADGRKLQTDREIYITLPGQFSERWTPRPPERPRRAGQPDTTMARQPAAAGSSTPQTPTQPLKEPASPQPKPAAPEAAAPADAAPLLEPPPALGNNPDGKPAKPQWKPFR